MKKKLSIVITGILLLIIAILVCVFINSRQTKYSIPKVYFYGDISKMESKKDERKISLKYVSDTISFDSFATLKVQGTSSLQYEKKNYNIKLYANESYEDKKGVDLGWGEQSKYCLKANWIDKTHARNVVTAKLVSEVQSKYGCLMILQTTEQLMASL